MLQKFSTSKTKKMKSICLYSACQESYSMGESFTQNFFLYQHVCVQFTTENGTHVELGLNIVYLLIHKHRFTYW